MSKIQDALKKIQSKKRGVSAYADVQEASAETIAIVVDETEAIGADSITSNRRYIQIDRILLREAGLLVPEDQERTFADQYRRIKRPLLGIAAGKYADQPAHANMVMIASALPGDGKTFSCINLSLSMAIEKDTSVLMVDADVGKPHISKILGVDQEPGLIDLLLHDDMKVMDVIMRTDIPGLLVLPAGQKSEYATELLASKRMADIAMQLSTKLADHVIVFDSPPLLITSEANVLASLMGQIVMIVCADRTPQQGVVEALNSLEDSKSVCLVLNQADEAFKLDSYSGFAYGYGT